MSTIRDISFRSVVRPLRVVFATAQGKKRLMQSIIVRVVLTDGSTGLGECPTSISLNRESTDVVCSMLHEMKQQFQGIPIQHYEPVIRRFRTEYSEYPMTISGIEVALFRAGLAYKKLTEHAYWGGKSRVVQSDITIPFVTDRSFLEHWIRYASQREFKVYKLKVSGNIEHDKKVLSEVHYMLRKAVEEFTLCLDGNEGYSKEAFCRFVDYIQANNIKIEFFEQPLARNDYQGLKEIKELSPFPIILDETVITSSDAQRVAEEGIAHGVNIKIAKSGIGESAAILAIAKKHKLKMMIGCMTESMIGLSAAVYLAAGTDVFDYIDLDSVFLLYHKNRFGNLSLRGPCFEIQP
ncbi:MAG TPA: enolase C-terminal domain-like protein [Syntrophorhabdus sp.]|nr:enolase C-terminal domain-like protein [Syntrophorhabdus sp.]